jgi:5-formyltetrahydrofolate cyclo-ligase
MTADGPLRGEPGGDAVSTEEARRIGLLARRTLTPLQRRDASAQISQRLLGLEEVAAGARIALYLALDDEVDLDAAVAPLRSRRGRLHLPRLLAGSIADQARPAAADAVAMELVEWVPSAELRANRYGVGEVVGGLPVPPDTMDVFVVPCVAVDPHGNRVGFGAGYYDRTLASAPEVPRIGVAFEAQLVARIQTRPWDVPMDVLVTERAVRRREGPC